MTHYRLLITSPTQSRVWAVGTLEQAEHRLAYMVAFYRITYAVTELDAHTFEAINSDGRTFLQLIEIESEKVQS